MVSARKNAFLIIVIVLTIHQRKHKTEIVSV